MPGIDEPDATDFVELMIKQDRLTLWTNATGEIVNYNAVTERADVKLVMNDGDVEIPLLHGVPVLWPKGGDSTKSNEWSQTAPLEKGNPVIVWFLVHNIASWLTDGVTGRTSKKRRRFSLSSPVCTPGTSHKGNLIPTGAKDPTAYVIRAALTLIHDLGSPEFVALSNLVDARLTTVQSTVDTHTHNFPVGPGVTLIPNSLIGSLPTTAAKTLKAE